jgi:hypothetical protein
MVSPLQRLSACIKDTSGPQRRSFTRLIDNPLQVTQYGEGIAHRC